jgi:hypothetical protein
MTDMSLIKRSTFFGEVLYVRETSSLTLKEQHWENESENRALRKISGPERDNVSKKWRRVHKEELYDLYF